MQISGFFSLLAMLHLSVFMNKSMKVRVCNLSLVLKHEAAKSSSDSHLNLHESYFRKCIKTKLTLLLSIEKIVERLNVARQIKTDITLRRLTLVRFE